MMESLTNKPPSADFEAVRVDEIRRAIDIYLPVAYPSSVVPVAVSRRLEWDLTRSPGQILTQPPFEKVGKGSTGCPIVALRLGNHQYPHMKIQIQTWQTTEGFLLSVNTHDHVLVLDPNSPDAAAFRLLQEENQRIKEAIEQAWDEAALPTFHRYLLDYIAANKDSSDGELD